MNDNSTELVFILDRSGSMSGLEADTIGGFNSMIKKQRCQEGKCFVSTFLFNHTTEMIHDCVLLENVEKMTEKDYVVYGCTALLDALGEAIHHIGHIHKYARPEDVPEHTIFIITTDGMENDSCKYDKETVKELIQKHEKEHGWEFLFMAANIDAVEAAKEIGICRERAAGYTATPKGTEQLYNVMSESVSSVRKGNGIREDWAKKLEVNP